MITSNTRVQQLIGLMDKKLNILLLKTKVTVVHAGHSLQLEHLKSMQTLNSIEDMTYLNKI